MKKSYFFKITAPHDLIVYNIGRLYVLLDTYLYNKAYRRFSLNPAKFNVLMLVKHVGKNTGLPQQGLSSNLCVSAANITKLVDGLQKQGLVQRLASRHDRRVNLIKITKKGSKLLDEVWPRHVQALNAILKKLSRDEKDKLNHFLQDFKEEMEVKIR
jgi:MarR family 2-MHQ and catechol resistance regulon transcriptional repressor